RNSSMTLIPAPFGLGSSKHVKGYLVSGFCAARPGAHELGAPTAAATPEAHGCRQLFTSIQERLKVSRTPTCARAATPRNDDCQSVSRSALPLRLLLTAGAPRNRQRLDHAGAAR